MKRPTHNLWKQLLVLAPCVVVAVAWGGEPDVYQRGKASWYGKAFHGRTTASGTQYDMTELTAAHKRLPFGTRVKVIRRGTDRSVVVTITDRGPYAKGRIIDLSRKAAQKIGMKERGTARVELKILSRPDSKGVSSR